METRSTQQEILLMTGTSFSSRQFCERDDASKRTPLSEKEQLQNACWNGLIKEMIPEICEHSADGKALYLWQIREGASFLTLDMGDLPSPKDQYYSIDPYYFFSTQSYS